MYNSFNDFERLLGNNASRYNHYVSLDLGPRNGGLNLVLCFIPVPMLMSHFSIIFNIERCFYLPYLDRGFFYT